MPRAVFAQELREGFQVPEEVKPFLPFTTEAAVGALSMLEVGVAIEVLGNAKSHIQDRNGCSTVHHLLNRGFSFPLLRALKTMLLACLTRDFMVLDNQGSPSHGCGPSPPDRLESFAHPSG